MDQTFSLVLEGNKVTFINNAEATALSCLRPAPWPPWVLGLPGPRVLYPEMMGLKVERLTLIQQTIIPRIPRPMWVLAARMERSLPWPALNHCEMHCRMWRVTIKLLALCALNNNIRGNANIALCFLSTSCHYHAVQSTITNTNQLID